MEGVPLFSRTLAAKANVGDPAFNLLDMPLNVQEALGEFVPTVGEKLQAIVLEVAAYREEGTPWTHFVKDSTGATRGCIVRLDGSRNELSGFFDKLDQLEVTYGLHRREREFILYGSRNPRAVRAFIYIADSVESLRDMDKVRGTLIRVD